MTSLLPGLPQMTHTYAPVFAAYLIYLDIPMRIVTMGAAGMLASMLFKHSGAKSAVLSLSPTKKAFLQVGLIMFWVSIFMWFLMGFTIPMGIAMQHGFATGTQTSVTALLYVVLLVVFSIFFLWGAGVMTRLLFQSSYSAAVPLPSLSSTTTTTTTSPSLPSTSDTGIIAITGSDFTAVGMWCIATLITSPLIAIVTGVASGTYMTQQKQKSLRSAMVDAGKSFASKTVNVVSNTGAAVVNTLRRWGGRGNEDNDLIY